LILSPTDAAIALGVTSGTLASWRRAGTGPAYIKLGYHTIGYRVADLETWVQGRRVAAERA
jgi:hypothetical protein